MRNIDDLSTYVTCLNRKNDNAPFSARKKRSMKHA